MYYRYRIAQMLSNDWKLPLNVAIGIHILVLLGGLYLPEMLKSKPKFADIYTVSIINIAEPAPAEQPAAQSEPATPPPSIKPVKPVKAKKVAPIEERIAETAPGPVKTVSLKPLKRKKKKKVVTKNNRADEARARRRQLAQALREEELLEEKARLAREALQKERELLNRKPVAAASPAHSSASNKTGATTQTSGGSNIIENQYYAAIINRLHQFWALPESLQNNPNLTAAVVVTISRNGQIGNFFFEHRSGDRVFDQFVNRTLEAANPLPAIPPALKKQRLEIGLRFRPGGIQQ